MKINKKNSISLLLVVFTTIIIGLTSYQSSNYSGQIYLYGEGHAVPSILDKEFELWNQYYHENGKIKTEVMFNALSKDEEAIVKTYDEKGVIISSGKVVNGEMVDVWTYYDEMGRKLNTYDLTKGVIVTYSEKGKVILKVSEKALLNRLEEIMVEVNNDRTRANEEKN